MCLQVDHCLIYCMLVIPTLPMHLSQAASCGSLAHCLACMYVHGKNRLVRSFRRGKLQFTSLSVFSPALLLWWICHAYCLFYFHGPSTLLLASHWLSPWVSAVLQEARWDITTQAIPCQTGGQCFQRLQVGHQTVSPVQADSVCLVNRLDCWSWCNLRGRSGASDKSYSQTRTRLCHAPWVNSCGCQCFIIQRTSSVCQS